MKTTVYILSALLTLNVFSLCAGINSDIVPDPKHPPVSLAPVTPAQATFDEKDAAVENPGMADLMKVLAPVTPEEADFNDDTVNLQSQTVLLTPLTPEKADFEEKLAGM